jgi:hypothetical protein
MLTLPMPMFGALVLMVLFLNLVLREGRYGLLAALIGLCAVQSAVIALAQHYGFGVARMVQPRSRCIDSSASLGGVSGHCSAPF